MVDISRNLIPWAAEQGVRDNIRFVRGNLCVIHHSRKLLTNTQSFDILKHIVSSNISRLETVLLIWSECHVLRFVSPRIPGVFYLKKSIVSW